MGSEFMQIGLIGLGKMGKNLALNLLSKGKNVVIYNRSSAPVKWMAKKGAIGTYSLKEFVDSLQRPRIIFIMVTAGRPVDEIIENLLPYLSKDDIIIDGGNSFYKDSIRRGKYLKKKEIHFLDVGISGGIHGARYGACIMVGGEKKIFEKVRFVFDALATKGGYKLVGKNGAGHFIKGIHNFIEYGFLGALAEGAETLKFVSEKEDLNIDLREVFELWDHGSICESRLLRDATKAFKKFPDMKGVSGKVFGETYKEMESILEIAKKCKIETQVIESAIKERLDSQTRPTYKGKVINAVRNIFGGHKFNK